MDDQDAADWQKKYDDAITALGEVMGIVAIWGTQETKDALMAWVIAHGEKFGKAPTDT